MNPTYVWSRIVVENTLKASIDFVFQEKVRTTKNLGSSNSKKKL